MFDSTFRARIAARTAGTLHTALDDWRAGDGGWFDNSIGSVDSRIAKAERLIHAFRSAGHSSFNDSIIAQLSTECDDLMGFRQSMLNAHQDREAALSDPVVDARYHVAARAFVRENPEVVTVPSEMRIRAANHADLHRLDDSFVGTVLAVARAVPKPRTAAVSAPTHVADFPDYFLSL